MVYINDDGSISNYENWFTTVDFYDISHCASIRLNMNTDTVRMFFYDSNQQFISYQTMTQNTDIDIPNNVKYARWTISVVASKRDITMTSKIPLNIVPSASDGSLIFSMYAPSNTVQPASGVWDLKGLELEEYHTFGLNNDVKLVDNTLTMPDRYDEYSSRIENAVFDGTIARYTASDNNTIPVFNEGYQYRSIIVKDGDVYKYILIAEDKDILPTQISFNSKSSLLTVEYLNVSNVTDMHGMFYSCRNLQSINASNWDTSNVTSMSSMFQGCSNLQSLDVSGWDTGNVTNMGDIFNNCSNLQSIEGIGEWDTGKVTDMSFMFTSCNNLTSLDLSGWDTGNVTNMNSMFSNCTNLQSLDSMQNIKTDLSVNGTKLDATSLFDIIDNLANLTSSKTLTLGSALLAKLTEEQIAIAVNKGWTIV